MANTNLTTTVNENLMKDELIDALRKASSPDGLSGSGVMTTTEICGALNMSRERVLELLRNLSVQGIIEPTRAKRFNVAGIHQKVYAYKLVQLVVPEEIATE